MKSPYFIFQLGVFCLKSKVHATHIFLATITIKQQAIATISFMEVVGEMKTDSKQLTNATIHAEVKMIPILTAIL